MMASALGHCAVQLLRQANISNGQNMCYSDGKINKKHRNRCLYLVCSPSMQSYTRRTVNHMRNTHNFTGYKLYAESM